MKKIKGKGNKNAPIERKTNKHKQESRNISLQKVHENGKNKYEQKVNNKITMENKTNTKSNTKKILKTKRILPPPKKRKLTKTVERKIRKKRKSTKIKQKINKKIQRKWKNG